jgi:hypothetical protein
MTSKNKIASNFRKIVYFPKWLVWITIKKIVNKKGGVIIFNHRNEYSAALFTFLDSVKKDRRNFLRDFEYRHIFMLVKKTEKIDGDVAEVGVYKGGSAKLISETTKKQVHLFDTFKGLPEVSEGDNKSQFKKGDYCAPYDDVRNYLKTNLNVTLYKGIFPLTAGPVKDRKFSFVHLDVDTYKSTLDCLEFFYPRMNSGGVIISHDYTSAIGVRKAFDEFFMDKREIIIDSLTGSSQCYVIKV